MNMIYILLSIIIILIVMICLLAQVIKKLQGLIEVILTAQSQYTKLQVRTMESIVNRDTK
jgi:predicted Holliday junction resolvase-like endonuclease